MIVYKLVIYATQKIVRFGKENGNLWILFMRGSTWSVAIFIL